MAPALNASSVICSPPTALKMMNAGFFKKVCSFFTFSTTEIPSIFGITRSRSTISGVVSTIISMASAPLSAVPITANPSSPRISSSSVCRINGLSSTIATFSFSTLLYLLKLSATGAGLSQTSRPFPAKLQKTLLPNKDFDVFNYIWSPCHISIIHGRNFRHMSNFNFTTFGNKMQFMPAIINEFVIFSHFILQGSTAFDRNRDIGGGFFRGIWEVFSGEFPSDKKRQEIYDILYKWGDSTKGDKFREASKHCEPKQASVPGRPPTVKWLLQR